MTLQMSGSHGAFVVLVAGVEVGDMVGGIKGQCVPFTFQAPAIVSHDPICPLGSLQSFVLLLSQTPSKTIQKKDDTYTF